MRSSLLAAGAVACVATLATTTAAAACHPGITVRPVSSPVFKSMAGDDDTLYPTVTVKAVLRGCSEGDSYTMSAQFVQGGWTAWAATGGGNGAWDVSCSGDGTDTLTMSFYNPDHPVHPGKARVSFGVSATDGSGFAAHGTRVVRVPRR